MILDTTTKSLQISLVEATATTECDITAFYVDQNYVAAVLVPGANDLTTSGNTPVVAVPSPAANVFRQVKEVHVYNADTVNHTVVFFLLVGAIVRTIRLTTIAPGETFDYFWDGVIGPKGDAGATGPGFITSGSPYELGFSVTGTMLNGEVLFQYVAPVGITLPINLTGSYAKADTAATGSTTLTIKKNGSNIGTIAWSAAGTTGTFTFSSSVSLAAGDILQIVAPSPADSTLANVGISLAATWT